MTTSPIIFANRQETSSSVLAGAMPISVNIVSDNRGAVSRRPGIENSNNVYTGVVDSNGIDGLHVLASGSIIAVASCVAGYPGIKRSIYKLINNISLTLSDNTDSSTELTGSGKPVFAETESILAISGGSYIQKIILSTDASTRLGGSPPEATHIITNALRLLANDVVVDKTKVRYSDVAIGTLDYSGHETWALGGVGLSGYFTAEARSDPVQAIVENTNSIWVFGTSTIQVFTPDPQYAFVPSQTMERGTLAPYSIIKFDEGFAWLDSYGRFVLSNGGDEQVISTPIGSIINDMSTTSDCFGYRLNISPYDCLVWTFPTEGKTLVYQQGAGWGQWQGTNAATTGKNILPVLSHSRNPFTRENLVGTTDGHIGRYSTDVYTDFGSNINAYVETGYEDHDTYARKHCKSVSLVFERGTTTSTYAPVGFLQYSDSPESWSEPLFIDFGTSPDRNPVVSFRSLGVYRTRAWRFTFSGDAKLTLAAAYEDYEVLGT